MMHLYLNKNPLGITNAAVELSVPNTVHLCRNPANMAFQFVLLYVLVHLLHLGLLLKVLGFFTVVSTHYHKVGKLSKTGILAIELNKSSDVLYSI